MKPMVKQSNRKVGFTIIELLTVMSIIVILIGLLVPATNMIRRYALGVRQRAQLHSIEAAIELFGSEFEHYPESDALDPTGEHYCGAMKLAEAMMGQDLLGFHPESIFNRDGTDGFGMQLYPDANSIPADAYRNNLAARRGPYLPLENANAYRLAALYADVGPFLDRSFVLCDVYSRVTNRVTGKRIGMPILYYRANTSNNSHNLNNPDDPDNIYNYRDNLMLLRLGMPWNPPPTGPDHQLANPTRFYLNTKNDKVTTVSRPFRADSFILISAGFDGEYGTSDDICNYEWRYQE